MPETKQITVYKFEELSDTAKYVAITDWVQHADIDLSWEIEDLQIEGDARGFDIEDIRYDVGHVQGAGASWHGRVNLSKFLDYHLKDAEPEHHRYVVLRELLRDGWIDDAVSVSYRGFRSVNSAAMEVGEIEHGALLGLFEDGASEAQDVGIVLRHPESILCGANVMELARGIDYEEIIGLLQGWVEHEAREYADHIFKALRDQYEWETGFEHFTELAEANEWRFDETGQIV